ncbi:MAG: 16S rRNA processing protein RimM [Desulfovibrionales bacterium]|nr:MAG: 16S rRNA processing protein RimM [Desulfovibrionales bacterium]
MPEQSLVLVGEIIKPHGLKGEFSVKMHVDSPDFFSQVSRLYLRRAPGERARRVGVVSQRSHNGRILLSLEQIQGRDEVERMRGAELLVRPEDLPRVSEEDVFLHDLVGMQVALPSKESLGRITAVSINAGQEVWTIRTAAEKEVLFPAHPNFILALDTDTKTACIDPPPGLLELYLGEDNATERRKNVLGG